MQGQTQFTFVGAQMVTHEIRILEDVDCLQSQLFQALTSILVCLAGRGNATAASLGSSYNELLDLKLLGYLKIWSYNL